MTDFEIGSATVQESEPVAMQVPISPTNAFSPEETSTDSEPAKEGNPPEHSPSVSLSSVFSSESTEKFIRSLSVGKLDSEMETEKETIVPQTTQAVTATPVQPSSPNITTPLPKLNNNPKQIKFTVRKVSRDTIAIPDSNKPRGSQHRDYAYGNLPENREKAQERRLSDKVSQLQHNQQKYDEYAARIEKISKEVDFLTNLLPPYNVEIDYVTRTKITKAIEKLRMKQDEIEKNKYSLGISISRLWREHDESEIFVRSVSKQ